MSGRRPAEAVDNYADRIQRARSCVTDGVISLLTDGRKPGGTRGLILNHNNLVPLQGPQKLHLHISQRYEIVEAEGERGPWKVDSRQTSRQ